MGKAKTSPVLLLSKTMRVSDILTLCPSAEHTLAEYGLACAGCHYNGIETLEEGCMRHGFDGEDIDILVEDLNVLLAEAPPRPQILTVTEAAAEAIAQVASDEGKAGEGLAVILDDAGGFCMEFRKAPLEDEKTFQNDVVKEVRIFASTLTLQRIGGSTIDFREGRFKLDLPTGDSANTACACGGNCSNNGTCHCD